MTLSGSVLLKILVFLTLTGFNIVFMWPNSKEDSIFFSLTLSYHNCHHRVIISKKTQIRLDLPEKELVLFKN